MQRLSPKKLKLFYISLDCGVIFLNRL